MWGCQGRQDYVQDPASIAMHGMYHRHTVSVWRILWSMATRTCLCFERGSKDDCWTLSSYTYIRSTRYTVNAIRAVFHLRRACLAETHLAALPRYDSTPAPFELFANSTTDCTAFMSTHQLQLGNPSRKSRMSMRMKLNGVSPLTQLIP